MFKQTLRLHWKALRLALLPLTMAAFALPLASVQGTIAVPVERGAMEQAAGVLGALQTWLVFYPALAAILGVSVALGVWAWDGQAKHVYALALPVTRQKYVLSKLGSGVLLIGIPVVALWVGSMLASASVEIPSGLHTYPAAVAFRFLLASLIAYSTVFAFAAWSGRRALIGFTLLAGALLVSDVVVSAAAATVAPDLAGLSPTAWLLESMVHLPGPFGAFTGNWALIDV